MYRGMPSHAHGGAAISVEFDAELLALPFDAPEDAAFATAALAVSAELDVKTPAAGVGPPPTPGGAPACGAEAAVAAVTRQRLPSGFPLLPADDEGPALPPALPPTARAAAAAPAEGGEPAAAGPLPQPAPTAPAQRLRFRALKNAVRQAKAVLASLGTLTDGAQALMEHPEEHGQQGAMDRAGHAAAASRSGQDAAAGEADAHASASSFLPGTRNHARAFVASSAANVSPQNLLSNGKAQLLTASGATVPLPAALLL
jgi:hypothetical protein